MAIARNSRAAMLSLPQTTGYAVKAMSCLSEPACDHRQIGDIAERAGVAKAYLPKNDRGAPADVHREKLENSSE